ncbi:MAG: hypothetical protein RIQ54_632 [Candidatus Parcubacteria bacterium]|jgi:hypothetical protein
MKFAFCLLPFFLMLLVLIPLILGSQEAVFSHVPCDESSVRLPSGVEISCFSVPSSQPATGYWILFHRSAYDTTHLYSLSLSPEKVMCFYGTREVVFLKTSSGWTMRDTVEAHAHSLSDYDMQFIDDCMELCRVLDASYLKHQTLRDAIYDCIEPINQFMGKTYRLRTLPIVHKEDSL